MKTDSLDVGGSLRVERVLNIPPWTSECIGRIIAHVPINTGMTYFYFGHENGQWKQLQFIMNTDNLHVADILCDDIHSPEGNIGDLVVSPQPYWDMVGMTQISLNRNVSTMANIGIANLIKTLPADVTKLKSLWIPGLEPYGSTGVCDIMGTQDLVLTNGHSIGWESYNLLKVMGAYGVNSTYITCGDNSAYSFTTGSADVDFTVGFVFLIDSVYNGYSAGLSKAGISSQEWELTLTGTYSSPTASLQVWDNNSGDWHWLKRSGPITPSRAPRVVIGTRTGSTMAIYVDGVKVDNTDASSGSYSRMRNTTQPVKFYPYSTASFGSYGPAFIINGEALSASKIRILSNAIYSMWEPYS